MSHTPRGRLGFGKSPAISGKFRLVNHYNLPRIHESYGKYASVYLHSTPSEQMLQEPPSLPKLSLAAGDSENSHDGFLSKEMLQKDANLSRSSWGTLWSSIMMNRMHHHSLWISMTHHNSLSFIMHHHISSFIMVIMIHYNHHVSSWFIITDNKDLTVW